MRKRTLFTIAAGILSFFAAASLPASAQNRLPQVIPAGSARAAVAHTVNPKVRSATDLGAASAGQQLTSMSLRFNMTAAQSAALDQLLANQQNPSSPQYHQWLTPAQFGAQFGVSEADLATVSNWLQAQGFTVTGVANGRTFITFSGTVAQVNQAFGVTLHNLTLNGEPHISNLTDPTLPTPLASIVSGITGLSDFRLKPRLHHNVVPATAKFEGGGGYGNLMAPGDFYTIYDLNPLLTASTPINGSGVTIAVMGQVNIIPSDITAFRTASGLSTSNVPTTILEGTTNPPSPTATTCNVTSPPASCGDLDESSLDLEWAGAVAPGATIKFVTGEYVFANSMTQAIDQDLAPILTVSYGDCESGFQSGSPNLNALNVLFKQANAQGQTVLGPAGDAGAADCDYNETFATQGLAVDFPASSPYVTAVGGTQFDEGSGTYWSTTTGANGGSALSYIPEQPWNEFFQTSGGALEGLNDGAGGGGVSSVFAKPSWQVGNGVPADASRDVPDIAFNAAANHDGYLVCVLGSCTNGGYSFTATSTTGQTVTEYNVFGGTSVATPSFAGILALLEQKVGPKLGNVNPNIYGLANSTYASTVFHDKTSGGTNAAPCTLGTPDCNTGYPNFYASGVLTCPANSCGGTIDFPAFGYVAGSGYVYDLATGWGSVDVANMVNDWLLATPEITAATAANPVTVTVSTTTPSVAAGAAVTITTTVASASTTTTTAPTGTVQLLVDNVPEGSAVTLSNGAASFPAFATTNLAAGGHTFAVSYSGDSNYAGGKGSVSVDITSASSADFQLTPATTTVTVVTGATAAGVTYTVTPLNGFVGDVSFSASTTSTTLNATYDFSVSPVVISSTTAGTTVLTLEAFQSASGNAKKGLIRRGGLTTATHRQTPIGANPWTLGGSGLALAGLILFGVPRRYRNRWSALLVALVSVGVLSAAGCSGPAGAPNTNNGNINTTPGTYTITITASGTSAAGVALTHNATLTFVVTP